MLFCKGTFKIYYGNLNNIVLQTKQFFVHNKKNESVLYTTPRTQSIYSSIHKAHIHACIHTTMYPLFRTLSFLHIKYLPTVKYLFLFFLVSSLERDDWEKFGEDRVPHWYIGPWPQHIGIRVASAEKATWWNSKKNTSSCTKAVFTSQYHLKQYVSCARFFRNYHMALCLWWEGGRERERGSLREHL